MSIHSPLRLSDQLSHLEGSDEGSNSQDELVSDPMIDLRDYRVKYVGKLIFATLNINSIRYKFDELKTLITGNIDVMVLTETKLDQTFPTAQFFLLMVIPPLIDWIEISMGVGF